MSAGLIVRIMHVASSSIHYKPVTLLHRHPSPCRNHGAGTMVWCNFAPWNLIYEVWIGRGWTPYGLIPIPLSTIPQSGKRRGESASLYHWIQIHEAVCSASLKSELTAHVSVNPSCWNRDKRKSLRLLSDELHRPTCERATPILYVWLTDDFLLPTCGSFANA